MITYKELKERQQAEINAFPLGAAFSKSQFEEMMAKWHLTATDTDKILSIGGGCYIRKSDKDVFTEMISRHAAEHQQAIDSDETGEGYIYQMFAYELANHEYGYTHELDDTFDALGVTPEEVQSSTALKQGLNKALKYYGDWQL